LMWALANEPRVPDSIRSEVARWGLARDEFIENGGWPHQIYVREARRMVGEYVMTQHHCQGEEEAPAPIGLAAYTMDSHNVQRYATLGKVLNEGDVQVGGFSPYPIAYGSIVPKQHECSNLIVPVCLSASHIAFGSIRMEPVFMVLGQSAAIAACQTIQEETAVQGIDREVLRKTLLEKGQVLEWKEPPAVGS
ncbi:MAG: FAD-dependent oxidoreductase, partial [bacterium]